jgi:hypothetical protein
MNYEQFLTNKITNWNFDNNDNKTIDEYNLVIENIKYSIVDISNYFSEFTSYDLSKFSTALSFNDYCNYILYFRYIEDLRRVHNESRSYDIFSNLDFDRITDKMEKEIEEILNSDVDDVEEFEQLFDYDNEIEDDEIKLNISKSELTERLKVLDFKYSMEELTNFYLELKRNNLSVYKVEDMVKVFAFYVSPLRKIKPYSCENGLVILTEMIKLSDDQDIINLPSHEIAFEILNANGLEVSINDLVKTYKSIEFLNIVENLNSKYFTKNYHFKIDAFVS